MCGKRRIFSCACYGSTACVDCKKQLILFLQHRSDSGLGSEVVDFFDKLVIVVYFFVFQQKFSVWA